MYEGCQRDKPPVNRLQRPLLAVIEHPHYLKRHAANISCLKLAIKAILCHLSLYRTRHPCFAFPTQAELQLLEGPDPQLNESEKNF